MVLSTPNRTARSRVLMVAGAERLGMIPRGTHHWSDFVTPDELRQLLRDTGLVMGEPRGVAWSPARGLHLSDDMALNYIVTATRAADSVASDLEAGASAWAANHDDDHD